MRRFQVMVPRKRSSPLVSCGASDQVLSSVVLQFCDAHPLLQILHAVIRTADAQVAMNLVVIHWRCLILPVACIATESEHLEYAICFSHFFGFSSSPGGYNKIVEKRFLLSGCNCSKHAPLLHIKVHIQLGNDAV